MTTLVQGVTRPRLVALTSNALLFFLDGTDQLSVIDLNPATLAADLVTTPTVIMTSAGEYDHAVASGNICLFAAALGGTHEVSIISSAAARHDDSHKGTPMPMGRSRSRVSPSGNRVRSCRSVAASIRADILNATTLADVSVNHSIGTAGLGHGEPDRGLLSLGSGSRRMATPCVSGRPGRPRHPVDLYD